jgi:putative inorganic carbon (HCO3(-)) transporter
MWVYTLGVLVLWAINPELRRVYGMYFGFSQVEILSVVPLIALLPYAWSLTFGGGWRRLPLLLSYTAWIWVGGFVYAFILAVLSGNLLSGAFSFISFVLPMGIGLWVAADRAPFLVSYRRITRLLFGLTTCISVYGMIQYVVAPVWDCLWLKYVIEGGATSFGHPAPFEIRVFSTLSDPGTFAVFLAWMLLLVLPELSLRKPLLLIQTALWLVTFALTLGRTAWIMVALGIVIYLMLSPRRAVALGSIGLIAAMVTGLAIVLPAAIGNTQALTSLSTRFSTFSDLENDQSRQDRQGLYEAGPRMIADAPFGMGLGVIGGSTKLSAKGATTDFDSGFLARAVEMGLPGFVLYVVPLLILLSASFRLWTQARASNDGLLQSVAGMAVAVEFSFAYFLLAHDVTGVGALEFWLIECIAIRALSPSAKRTPSLQHGDLLRSLATPHLTLDMRKQR